MKTMFKKAFMLLIVLISLATFNSCTFATTGESLEAFSRRMNELNESYNMTSDGYIIDISENSLTKFFKYRENEIMLNFRYDKKNRLNELNIVFNPCILEESPESSTFIYDCIKCFCQDENTTKKILESTNFENTIKNINMKTISTEADNIKMKIDTTQLGTVVTIYKDI